MQGLIGTPVRHIAQIDTPIFVWEINTTHFFPASFKGLMGLHHLLCNIIKYQRTKCENRLLVKHADFRQPAPVIVLVYSHTETALMDTCLKTYKSGLAFWQLDQPPAFLVTGIRSQTV